MVVRLPLSTTLEEVRRTACLEKNLDPAGYQLVRPGIPTQPLDLHCSLLEYGASEVMLLSNRSKCSLVLVLLLELLYLPGVRKRREQCFFSPEDRRCFTLSQDISNFLKFSVKKWGAFLVAITVHLHVSWALLVATSSFKIFENCLYFLIDIYHQPLLP